MTQKTKHSNNKFKSKTLNQSNFSTFSLLIFALIFTFIGGYLIFHSRAAVTCNLNATTSNFASQVSAATTGQTICLATGSYGTWTGTNKAITISVQPGATPTMALDLNNGDTNFTIDGQHTKRGTDGLKITSAGFHGSPGPSNITIKNTLFSSANGAGGMVEIDGPTNTNIVFDNDEWANINGWEASLRFPYDGPSYVTIQNSLFRDSDADGVKIGASHTTVKNSEFDNIKPSSPDQHTDAIQLCCGYSSGSDTGSGSVTITGNYFHGFEQAIGAFDGTGNNTIKNNVLVQNSAAHWITLGGDRPASTVQHNTLQGTGNFISCSSKAGFQPSLTIIRDNFTPDVNLNGGGTNVTCTPTANDHNMSGGSAIFVGPTTSHDGYLLASNSPVGRNAASDGTDIGIFAIGGVTPPPPDTTPPTVSLTAPTPGSTVSGSSVSVTATASDNIGVSGVQFKLDGANLGTEDTSSPYSTTWNTTTATNATHTLTAVARDAAGNSTTSSSVSVTVNNTSPTPTATISANPTSISSGSSSTLTWSSTNATSCSASNGWSGTKATSGTQSVSPTATTTYTMTCTGAGGTSSPSNTTVTVTAATKPGDFNNDNSVNIFDLSIMLTNYGKTTAQSSNPACDMNSDGTINIFDLSSFLSKYGT